ncbi:MAG: sulfotransferase family 2 domain-containing protein [Thermodesulfovibrionales bacterium]|nr:sulfotransferase family 2 domain-containing protein [Thermodesulfovibrionales bacterium]
MQKQVHQGRNSMIISHKYKFIFLKTEKTAGTSMEIALSRFCGEQDIITPITPEDEIMRHTLGYRGSQNYSIPVSEYSFRDYLIFLIKRKRKRFYNHITAREVKNIIGEKIWDSYYKFCFERNPWDRVMSLYYWRYKKEPRPALSHFIDSKSPRSLKKRGYEVYTIDDSIAVDKVYLFENLTSEIEIISSILGFPEKLKLPRAKSSFRDDKRHYREILINSDKKKIEKIFSKEIALFGYEF